MPASVYEETRKTYNTLGRAYVRSIEPLVPEERKAFAKTLAKGSRVLEVGCAGGRDAQYFVKEGLRVTGIDTSTTLLALAKKRVPKGRFIFMDVRKLAFPPKSFDAVWANAVLLHLQRQDVPPVLRRLQKVLVPGGCLHVRVKVGRGSGWVTDTLSKLPRFFTYFTKKEMESLLRHAGFSIQSSRMFADQGKRRDVHWVSIEATAVTGLVK